MLPFSKFSFSAGYKLQMSTFKVGQIIENQATTYLWYASYRANQVCYDEGKMILIRTPLSQNAIDKQSMKIEMWYNSPYKQNAHNMQQVHYSVYNKYTYEVNTLRPRQMDAISQTFSNAFFWMKIFQFRL